MFPVSARNSVKGVVGSDRRLSENPPSDCIMAPARNVREYKARTLIEKKTVLNLLEAFA